ncbi:MAG: hypothetical protein A2Y60_01745 [Chloroflexi bacterium RBG_13_54_9]|jgi:nucleotide-binding universal stress UspA family protein|nr:MAG: hypothetical protein A2Y60_01745 [Chloroflexi bacterium RBG_13_54_9]HJX70003.1 universal stress protein [Dehalococcoidia bacterium]
MFKVLLATDGSEYSQKAARYIGQLCEKLEDCEITALYVKNLSFSVLGLAEEPYFETLPDSRLMQEQLDKIASSALAAAQEVLKDSIQRVILRAEWGRPPDVICRVAEQENFDLIVVGERGIGGIAGLFLGSVSQRVATRAKAPVLIVH